MKSKFKIEKGIEAPKPYGGNYPFKDMSVGESFLVPDGKTSRIKIVGATQSMSQGRCEAPRRRARDRRASRSRQAIVRFPAQGGRGNLINHEPGGFAMTNFNKLSAYEAERLALLSEELGEAVQAIGKILRHGYESADPNGGPNNRSNLEKELGDVRHAVIRMCEAGDIKEENVSNHADVKRLTVAQYLHYN